MNVTVTSDRKMVVPLDSLAGTFRTFGRVGPVYEILQVNEPATGPQVTLKIRVIESGEQLDYPLSDALDDPLAR
jgi:Family of unknown function (DUF5397)